MEGRVVENFTFNLKALHNKFVLAWVLVVKLKILYLNCNSEVVY